MKRNRREREERKAKYRKGGKKQKCDVGVGGSETCKYDRCVSVSMSKVRRVIRCSYHDNTAISVVMRVRIIFNKL